MAETKNCSNCGKENEKNAKFCGSCGILLNNDQIPEKLPKKISGTITPNQVDITKKIRINFVALISGLFTAIIIYFIYFFNIIIIPALFSGIVAGYFTSKGNYLKSILYGALTSLIGISISYAITNILYNSIFSIENTYISIQPLQFVEIMLLALVLGAIGGFIGTNLRKRII